MPMYKYKCPNCGNEHKWGSRQQPVCKECGEKMVRVYGPPGIILKGGGFFSTEDRNH